MLNCKNCSHFLIYIYRLRFDESEVLDAISRGKELLDVASSRKWKMVQNNGFIFERVLGQ